MGKTIVEKILSAHTDTDNFKIGDIIKARVDFTFANDITAPIALKYFKESGAKQVFDKKEGRFNPRSFCSQ
ncbi:3-isopropylmalate dehydratase large subunit [subsurface metagenome]